MENINIYEELKEVTKNDFNKFKDSLPFSIYITHADGTIVDFNKEAGLLLNLDRDKKNTITSFYYRNDDRKRLIDKINREFNDQDWIKNQTLNFSINKKKVSLRYFAKIFKKDGIFVGSICLVFEITEFERFRDLSEIPFGIFEVGPGNEIEYSNKKFNEIVNLKNEPSSESEREFMTDFIDKDKYKNIVRKLSKDGVFEDEIELIRKNRVSTLASVGVWVDERYADGKVAKAKGYLIDTTFSNIIKEVPIGLFRCKLEDNNLKLEICNNYFAHIFGDGSIDTLLGLDMRFLINNDEGYNPLLSKIIGMDYNMIARDYLLQSETKNGKKEIIVHIKKNLSEERCIGVVYDVTDDVHRMFAVWKKDFAGFLHSYSAMISSIKDTLQSIIASSSAESVYNRKLNIDHAYFTLKGHINGFKTIYKNYFKIIIETGRYEKYDDVLYLKEEMDSYLEKIEALEKENISKVSIATFRYIFVRIRGLIYNQSINDKLPKVLVKSLKNSITDIFRYARLVSLYYIEHETYEMYIEVEEFKEALRYGSYESKQEQLDGMEPLRNAITNLQEYAYRRKIEIRNPKNMNIQIQLLGDQRELYSAFYNVINNAIKYSFLKPEDKISWIDIRIENRITDVDFVFENRGLAIPQEEIDSGNIYQFGNRGWNSSDRKKRGNGIGLWHTKEIIKNTFKGDINIKSNPLDSRASDFYNQPFITTVTLSIPRLL